MVRKDRNITDNEIYYLRKKGLTYEEIVKHFKERGKDVNFDIIYRSCKRIFRIRHEKEPYTAIKKANRIKITNDEIFEQREKGLDYKEIAEHFTKQGREISLSSVRAKCKEIYMQKGKEEPKKEKKKNEKKVKEKNEYKYVASEISDEEIFKKREEGLSYEAIAEFFTNEGRKITHQRIGKRCERIYKLKNKEQPKVQWLKKIGITDDEVYELRNKRFSYKEIAEHFVKQGKIVSSKVISDACKRIYTEKSENEPTTRRKSKTILEKLEIKDEEIIVLREQGLSYEAIAELFTNQGKNISWITIRARCKTIYGGSKNEPKVKRKPKSSNKTKTIEDVEKIKEGVLKLKETRGATEEQMREIAKLYGVNLSENIIQSSNEENNSESER